MSQQALDLRGFVRTVRRHRAVVGVAAGLGLVAGAVFAVLHPPMLASKALVVLASAAPSAASGPTRNIRTQVVVASSDAVLASVVRSVGPAMSLGTLRGRVQVSSVTSDILATTGQGKTAAQGG